MPRKRCTSSTPSMPNARVSERTREGRTAAHTSADSASSPVTTDSCAQTGSERSGGEPHEHGHDEHGAERGEPRRAHDPLVHGPGRY